MASNPYAVDAAGVDLLQRDTGEANDCTDSTPSMVDLHIFLMRAGAQGGTGEANDGTDPTPGKQFTPGHAIREVLSAEGYRGL